MALNWGTKRESHTQIAYFYFKHLKIIVLLIKDLSKRKCERKCLFFLQINGDQGTNGNSGEYVR